MQTLSTSSREWHRRDDAQRGYAENEFGDSVPLPTELSYLGHGRKL